MGTVHLDPSQLRRVAERLLGDREFDFRPELNKASKDLRAETAMDDFGASDETGVGFVEGVSSIGKFHAECIDEMLKFFANLDGGLIAVSNVLASVSEDFTDTDVDSEANTSAIMEYFTPPSQPQVQGQQ